MLLNLSLVTVSRRPLYRRQPRAGRHAQMRPQQLATRYRHTENLLLIRFFLWFRRQGGSWHTPVTVLAPTSPGGLRLSLLLTFGVFKYA